jgi:L-fucose mutarotase
VSLQLAPGIPTVAQAFAAVLATVRIDAVHTMGVDRSDSYAAATPGDPPAWEEYRRIIAAAGMRLVLEPIVKWDFYAAVASPDHVLTIQTADTQPWANLLLTLGCRTF